MRNNTENRKMSNFIAKTNNYYFKNINNTMNSLTNVMEAQIRNMKNQNNNCINWVGLCTHKQINLKDNVNLMILNKI